MFSSWPVRVVLELVLSMMGISRRLLAARFVAFLDGTS
jgi:hypothetical protein